MVGTANTKMKIAWKVKIQGGLRRLYNRSETALALREYLQSSHQSFSMTILCQHLGELVDFLLNCFDTLCEIISFLLFFSPEELNVN